MTPLGTGVDIGAGHIVLDGFRALRERGTAPPPSFRPMSSISATAELLLIFYSWQNSLKEARAPEIYNSIPAKETAKHRAKLLTFVERRRCSNEAKTRNPLKFAGVPQTHQQISTVCGPKFTILWEHVVDICCLTSFLPIIDTCLSCEDKDREMCAMVPRWRFLAISLRPVFQRAACSTFQTCILNSH